MQQGHSPTFYEFIKENDKEMRLIKFDTLDDAISCYGRDNLVAIDCLKQIIFYTQHGCQPKFVWESENAPGKITAWFLKDETTYVYKKWTDNRPEKHEKRR